MSINNLKSAHSHMSQLTKNPGNKAAIVRLCLVAAILIGGLLLTVCTLPPITDGLGDFLTAFATGTVISIMFAAIVWGFAKWAKFIFPKSLAVANRFWNSWYALGIIGVAIKAMIWLYILMLPVTLFGIVLTPLYLVVYALSLIGSEFVSGLILTLLLTGALFFMVLLDVCKLKQMSWKQALRTILGNARQAIAATKQKVLAKEAR